MSRELKLYRLEPVGREPIFAEWLFDQRGRESIVGELADNAAIASDFPWKGSPSDVRVHLAVHAADYGWFEALDYAIKEWMGR